jgi:hypothetical protein
MSRLESKWGRVRAANLSGEEVDAARQGGGDPVAGTFCASFAPASYELGF